MNKNFKRRREIKEEKIIQRKSDKIFSKYFLVHPKSSLELEKVTF